MAALLLSNVPRMLDGHVGSDPLGQLMARVQEEPTFHRAYCAALGAVSQLTDENARFYLEAFINDLWVETVVVTSRIFEEAWTL